MPRLAIIIVTFNSAADVGTCLESIPAAAAATAHDVVVVDNASADGTAALVRERFPDDVCSVHAWRGDLTAEVKPGRIVEVCRFLRDDAELAFDFLADLTAVDYPEREPRFEMVAHFYSLGRGHRLRLKTRTGDSEGDEAEVDSLTDLWASANWMEREVFDMFGVIFKGHPDLRRILMYPEFVGHPLRKDYPADKIQPLVPFRDDFVGKLAPFESDEGMSFGRQTHDYRRDEMRRETQDAAGKVLPPIREN